MSKKRGGNKRGGKKQDSDEEEVVTKPQQKGRGKKKQDSEDEEEVVKSPPKKGRGKKQESDEEEEVKKAPPPKGKGKNQKSSDAEEEEEEEVTETNTNGSNNDDEQNGKEEEQNGEDETQETESTTNNNNNNNTNKATEETGKKLPSKPVAKPPKKSKIPGGANVNEPHVAGGGNRGVTTSMKTIMNEASKAGVKGSVTSQYTVKLDDVNLEFSGKHLLENTSLTLAFGHRYGLVGPNGSGKSTLMRALGTREIKGIPNNIQVLYVEQEVDGSPDKTALDMVVEADTERLELFAQQKELEAKRLEVEAKDEYDEELQEKITEVHKRLHEIGAHSAEHRARVILIGLQFTERMQTCPTSELSGGWRMRIALARSLFCRPHLLLLDEPSNHLDLYACFWLEGFLSKWKKTLLVVSHDVDMLNAICTDIIQLDPSSKKLVQFRGNYDAYLAAAELRNAEYTKAYDKQLKKEKEIKALKGQILSQGKSNASKAGSKKGDKGRGNQDRSGGKDSASKAIAKKIADWEKEPKLDPPPKDYNVKFSWDDPDTLPHPVLQVRGVSFNYPGETREIFRNLELGVDLDLRVAVVGRNGVGKSTLMKIVLKELQPSKGEVIHANKLKIAYFSQHFIDTLPLDKSAVKYIMDEFKKDEKEARKYLGRFGITKEQQVNRMETLSGGQKSRVMFCKLALDRPHIMFLDEPTNHLDIQSIEALAEGLRNFKGGVFLITHNQRLIGASCDRVWIVEGNQSVTVWRDEFKEYQKAVMKTLDFDDDEDD